MQESKLFHLGPPPSKILLLYCKYIVTSLKRLGQVAGARHASACATILRFRALLCQVACATIIGCVRYYVRLRTPPLCMHQYIVTSFKRLGQVAGARHASACATILRLRALLFQVACSAMIDCVRYYVRLLAPPLCMHQYIVTSLKWLGQLAGARHASGCTTILMLRALLCQVGNTPFDHPDN